MTLVPVRGAWFCCTPHHHGDLAKFAPVEHGGCRPHRELSRGVLRVWRGEEERDRLGPSRSEAKARYGGAITGCAALQVFGRLAGLRRHGGVEVNECRLERRAGVMEAMRRRAGNLPHPHLAPNASASLQQPTPWSMSCVGRTCLRSRLRHDTAGRLGACLERAERRAEAECREKCHLSTGRG